MATVTLEIPDDVLKREGLTEKEMRIELACRLFDAQKMSKAEAGRLSGLSRDEFNAELMARNLPVIRIDEEYMAQEFEAIEKMRAMDGDRRQ
jgi:predicted HTH domain antitoxin